MTVWWIKVLFPTLRHISCWWCRTCTCLFSLYSAQYKSSHLLDGGNHLYMYSYSYGKNCFFFFNSCWYIQIIWMTIIDLCLSLLIELSFVYEIMCGLGCWIILCIIYNYWNLNWFYYFEINSTAPLIISYGRRNPNLTAKSQFDST